VLNCKPWELIEAPYMWVQWAITAMTAENEAREAMSKKNA
jgi:hypothetical protein